MRADDSHHGGLRTPQPARLLAGAIAEASFLGLVLGAFLAIYLIRLGGSTAIVGPYVGLVATFWGACLVLRMLVFRIVRPGGLARWLNASMVLGPLLLLVICELGFAIGLSSWGRVPTWPMIRAYAPQSAELLGALGLAPGWVGLVLIIPVVGAFAFLARSSAAIHWVGPFARHVSGRWFAGLLVVGCLIVSVRTYAFIADPPVRFGEPFSLMLFPEHHARPGQSRLTPSNAAEAAEIAARAAYVPESPRARPNVILIVGDALREDHLSVNGYARETTPFIDSLVASGRARSLRGMASVCAESTCGLMAIAQSRYAHQFPGNAMTLYEVLRLHGYSVRMILGGDHTHFYGLRESFGPVDDYFDGSMAAGFYANDDRLVLDRVSKLPGWDGKPVMMQLHLMSSHVLGKRHESFERFRPFASYARPGGPGLGEPGASAERARNFYDNGVLQFDEMVRRIFDELGHKGYLRNSIVVITSDHGEMLGEHGAFSHSAEVYQGALRIPFVAVGFGSESFRSGEAVPLSSQADIAPTILRELGMPIPSTWAGRALQSEADRDYIYFQQGPKVGLFDLREPGAVWKYWLDLSTREEFAFDLATDPAESNNAVQAGALAYKSRWRLAVGRSGASVAALH